MLGEKNFFATIKKESAPVRYTFSRVNQDVNWQFISKKQFDFLKFYKKTANPIQ